MNNKVETKYSAFIFCDNFIFAQKSKKEKTIAESESKEKNLLQVPILPSDLPYYVIRIILHLNFFFSERFGSNC